MNAALITVIGGKVKEATHIAAAIVSKWKREGRPTSESVAFSETEFGLFLIEFRKRIY